MSKYGIKHSSIHPLNNLEGTIRFHTGQLGHPGAAPSNAMGANSRDIITNHFILTEFLDTINFGLLCSHPRTFIKYHTLALCYYFTKNTIFSKDVEKLDHKPVDSIYYLYKDDKTNMIKGDNSDLLPGLKIPVKIFLNDFLYTFNRNLLYVKNNAFNFFALVITEKLRQNLASTVFLKYLVIPIEIFFFQNCLALLAHFYFIQILCYLVGSNINFHDLQIGSVWQLLTAFVCLYVLSPALSVSFT